MTHLQTSIAFFSDERIFDFDNWDLDKDGILTGYEVNGCKIRLKTDHAPTSSFGELGLNLN